MVANICLRKQRLIVIVLLFVSGIILLQEKVRRLDRICRDVNQFFRTMASLGRAEDRKQLFKNLDKVLKWQQVFSQDNAWKPSATAFMQYRKELGQCCNGSHHVAVTMENAQLGSHIKFDGDKFKNITVDANLRSMLLKRFPLAHIRHRKCAVVGNGGILLGSKCGHEIDQADFIIRFNLPPLDKSIDVGTKTHLMTINPSIFSKRFKDLGGSPMDFVKVLQTYPGALFLIPALSFDYHLKVTYRVMNILKENGMGDRAFFLHPHYLAALDKYWKQKGIKEIRMSTGFMFTSYALEVCDIITLYGFWPFLFDLKGGKINHHYFNNELPHPLIHAMPEEFSRYLNLSAQGVLRLHLGKCW
ncbi:alpha-N-acetylneuraminide alpha-2,8-sialyltransferase-like [Erythrolamprus reginae]|uniref:alpha-N-acetylneuraminide alpha-2,8-sialyltransferase-like n=1 Tax=Erythrolamprus reginae TaxID=121349 RepID=UPI00396CD659